MGHEGPGWRRATRRCTPPLFTQQAGGEPKVERRTLAPVLCGSLVRDSPLQSAMGTAIPVDGVGDAGVRRCQLAVLNLKRRWGAVASVDTQNRPLIDTSKPAIS